MVRPIDTLSDQTTNMLINQDEPKTKQPIMSPKIKETVETGIDKNLAKEAEDYIENVNKTEDPIQAVLYANMLTKGKEIVNRVTGEIRDLPILNLDENIKAHRDAIVGFFRNAVGREDYDPRDVAWCAAFVDATLTKIGADRLTGDGGYSRIRAREYVNYGEPVELDNIREGDIIVLDFIDPDTGKRDGRGDHVGFHTSRMEMGFSAPNSINMLGGNQAGMGASVTLSPEGKIREGGVSVKAFSKKDVLAVRRITRNNKPWEGVKDQNPLFFYQSKTTPSYGFNEGGEVLDAEGRRRRRVSQDYLDRSKEATRQTVENIAGMLPGVGTAMTGEEIKEELEKENPNYKKVALLGGAELIGLIPGLGAAAKSGLRAVAKKVGLEKVADALDTPTPKPESEIIASEKGLFPQERVGRRRRKQFTSTLDPGLSNIKRKPLVKAKEMKQLGITEDKIFEQTGLVFDPVTKSFRFEIDDTKAILDFSADEVRRSVKDPKFIGASYDIDLKDFLSHPELFARYPDLNSFVIQIKRGEDVPSGATAQFSPTDKAVILNADKVKNNADLKNSVFHELQHGVQFLENFDNSALAGAAGTNNRYIDFFGDDSYLNKLRGNLKKSVNRHDEIQRSVTKNPSSFFGNPSVINEYKDLKKRIAYETKALQNYSYALYRRNMGEIEASVVSSRTVSDDVMRKKAEKEFDSIKQAMDYSDADAEGFEEIYGKPIEDFRKAYLAVSARKPFYKDVQDTVELRDEYIKEVIDQNDVEMYIKKDIMPQEEKDKIFEYGKQMIRALDKKAAKTPISPMTKADPNQFAQGGVAMNKQMEMAFMNQGGLKDDGMKQDPVSGNPIPNGSMAEEVRDDIPAQLSEGEYVVPADVVRYYGVKHFEDIRNNAKQGLQSMEANGRIGGEPVPVGGPKAGMQQQMASDLSQDEMQEIQSMMMNVGGFVEQPADPYQQQQTMYQQPMVAGASNGADFGFTPSNSSAYATTPTVMGGGFSFEQPKQSNVQVTQTPVTLYGPNGEEVTILLPNDQLKYNDLIAKGYSTVKPSVQTNRDKDPTEIETPDPNAWMDSYNYNDPKLLSEQITAALTPGGGKGGFLSGLGNFIKARIAPPGSVLGMFSAGSVAAQSAANIMALAKIKGENDPSVLAAQKLLDQFKIDNKLEPIKDFITGKDLFKDIQERNPNLGSTKPVVKRRTPGVDIDKFVSTKSQDVQDYKKDSDKRKSSGSSKSASEIVASQVAGTTAGAAGDTAAVGESTTTTGGVVGGYSTQDLASQYASYRPSSSKRLETGGGDRGQNKGGLMRKKKTKGK